ncbi:hypothetical protein B6D16_12000 [Gilliamella apicola]|uniref:AAA family ATPase n=2 Tax=Gilliamella apicola TaxID=1196095 RepID=UPI000A35AAEC|nr:AAA family ATPase [Gilliamella apicola]OTP88217.1 hypothetical protein B5S41_10225 [Gilliamella apicola]OTP92116.1 hypothetical protein B6D05_12880 [Gilliamella apicola]OTP94339.1 hypothetical protein B6D13_07405 [Gilliamella apicola]OTQ00581.1 hypothetical protein B6D07_10090 [Gilliamella apicola]OTQ14471.1 hypothetical protein B6D16_12000 [Gilliamella apicola]
MKIESLKIENVGGISSLTLDKFHPNLNIICGENGIGKTNILDSIAHCFSTFSNNIIRKKEGSKKGKVCISIDDVQHDEHTFNITSFKPRCNTGNLPYNKNLMSFHRNIENLIYFKTERLFSHKWIERLNIYDQKRDHLYNLDGVSIGLAKDWFIKNELLSSQKYTKDNDKNSIELAKKAFGLLNQSCTFSALRQDMEIYVNTPTGVIPYEYLSSGFKTCISIVWGIIREVQIRFPNIDVKDFKGVVLIDEIELHLHPEWQGKICNTLVTLFPEIQFFITTHSPHVVQTAEADQVIALSGQDGYLEKRTLDIAPNGFKGWTIEEILMDVMGMKDTRTEWFRNKQKEFNEALDLDNVLKANNIFKELKEKLHPNSTDLALFRFQLDMLNGRNK